MTVTRSVDEWAGSRRTLHHAADSERRGRRLESDGISKVCQLKDSFDTHHDPIWNDRTLLYTTIRRT